MIFNDLYLNILVKKLTQLVKLFLFYINNLGPKTLNYSSVKLCYLFLNYIINLT